MYSFFPFSQWPKPERRLLKTKYHFIRLSSLSYSDIVIPGANNSSDTQTKISAGESVHIIRGTKGNSSSIHPLSAINKIIFFLNICLLSLRIWLTLYHHAFLYAMFPGTYIRTSDGRIFAIRAIRKSKQSEESTNTKKGIMSSYFLPIVSLLLNLYWEDRHEFIYT